MLISLYAHYKKTNRVLTTNNRELHDVFIALMCVNNLIQLKISNKWMQM